ncbi:hypothetical protein I79_026162 [Cricetulus griseus]|uniref:Uncharacterized protein n=1 Tax=Cricetulus griseus TaxID=10029 RepID=G3IQ67_CRIGR|nr:hypothetical protein I79_026162 [Cricetulus griseus]
MGSIAVSSKDNDEKIVQNAIIQTIGQCATLHVAVRRCVKYSLVNNLEVHLSRQSDGCRLHRYIVFSQPSIHS